MNKVIVSLAILLSLLSGAEKSNWTHTYKYTLKKDELAKISFSNVKSKDKYSFFFRWTTIVSDRVTVLLNYKGYPHQYILYKKRSLDRVKFFVLSDGKNRLDDKSYIIVALDEINQEKKIVSFDIFIKDDKNRILVEF